ncbi:hypothetical protein C8J57DRAFT_1572020, partial [Mycena rebaudengoi]
MEVHLETMHRAQDPTTINYVNIIGDHNNTCVQGTQYNNMICTPLHQNRPDRQDGAGSIPQEVERIILNHPLLLQVLGIAIVLREDHRTIPLISCVLGCTWAQVKEALLKISPDTEFIESELKITMDMKIMKWLVDRGEEERRQYHAKVACWCLVGNWGNDTQCKLYAAKNWAYHTTRSCLAPPVRPWGSNTGTSRPYPWLSELYDALLCSRLPFSMASCQELPKVIEWLQGAQFSRREELIDKLQEKSRKWRPPVLSWTDA